MIRAFIFDVDGTLVDSNRAHESAWREALERLGYASFVHGVREMVGIGSAHAVRRTLGLDPEAPASRQLRALKASIFDRRYKAQVKPFPKVPELMNTLREKGIKLAVASSATGAALTDLVRIAGVEGALPCESCAPARSKPDPEKISLAAAWLGVGTAECVMVGDTPFDAQAAHAAGARFVGVRCGGWEDGALEPAIAIYDDPAHLLRRLDELLDAAS